MVLQYCHPHHCVATAVDEFSLLGDGEIPLFQSTVCLAAGSLFLAFSNQGVHTDELYVDSRAGGRRAGNCLVA